MRGLAKASDHGRMKRAHRAIRAAAVGIGVDLRVGPGDSSSAVRAAQAQNQGDLQSVEISAYSGGTIRQWWSIDPVVVDLAGMRVPREPGRLVLLRDHAMSRPMGHGLKIAKSATGLDVSGVLSVQGRDTDEFVSSSQNGFPWRASIGAVNLKVAYVREGTTLRCNGREFAGPVAHVVECDLQEVSIVTLGADDDTYSVAASEEQTQQRDAIMKKILASAQPAAPDGSAAPATPPAAGNAPGVAASAPSGQTPPPASATPSASAQDTALHALRLAQAAETERMGSIRAIAGITPAIEAQAIREGWAPERAELAVLRAQRSAPGPVGILVPSQPAITPAVIAAALCQSLNTRAEGNDQTLQCAQDLFHGRMGLQQLIYVCAQAGGYNGSPFLRTPDDLRQALRAAFSTGTLAGVLSNASNKMLMDAFNHVEQSWRKVAKVNPNVQDFKEYSTYAFTGETTFEKIAPDGQIKHGTLSDAGFANKLDTYAKIMGLTRHDIINDDLGMLSSMSQKVGRGAGLALNLAFWIEWLADNLTFYTTARGNYISGAGTVLASAGLEAAHKAFMAQSGSDGNPLGAVPKYLAVPTDLEITAEELMTSTNLNSGSGETKAKATNRNVFAGKYEVVPSSYLNHAKVTGGSATAWWLTADPLDLPLIEVGFLRGALAPTVEEVAMDPHYLGIEIRGYFDFGVRKQVYQAAVKSKGAA